MLWAVLATLTAIAVAAVVYYFGFRSTVSDADIVQNVKAAFFSDANLRECAIEVTAQNRIVTLAGFVNTDAEKADAVRIASQQMGVRQVVDQLVAQSFGGGPAITHTPPTFPERTSPRKTSVRAVRIVGVPGNQPWTLTGVFLSVGDVVEISATGTVSIGAGSPPMPPSGRPPDCGGRGGFPAPQIPCWSLIGRIGEQGSIFYVGSKITFRAPTSGELLLGVNDDILGDNSGRWTATVIVQRGYVGMWLGFANETSPQDRETELHQSCDADFRRVYVPLESGNRFTDLCRNVGKTCQQVCDWEGRNLPCNAISLGGARDGTRIALCR